MDAPPGKSRTLVQVTVAFCNKTRWLFCSHQSSGRFRPLSRLGISGWKDQKPDETVERLRRERKKKLASRLPLHWRSNVVDYPHAGNNSFCKIFHWVAITDARTSNMPADAFR